jgi:hypothetical protein
MSILPAARRLLNVNEVIAHIGKGGSAMDGQTARKPMNWRDVTLRGVILLPFAVGALLGITQALILLCVLAFLLLPL